MRKHTNTGLPVFSRIMAFVLILALLWSPAENADAAVKPMVAKTKLTMVIDDYYEVELKNVKATAKVTYSSSNEDCVMVSEWGWIDAVGEGDAVVTVNIRQNKKTYKRKINISVKEAYLNYSKLKLNKGESMWLYANGASAIKFSSTKKSVAKVNQNGCVTAKKAGKATIKVRCSNGKTYKCAVTVLDTSVTPSIEPIYNENPEITDAPKITDTPKISDAPKITDAPEITDTPKITEAPEEEEYTMDFWSSCSELKVGEEYQFTANSYDTVLDKITWSVDRPDVASVDSDGNLRGLKIGRAVVTAKSEDYDISCSKIVMIEPADWYFTVEWSEARGCAILSGCSGCPDRVVIPDGIEIIGDGAFTLCSVKDLVIPDFVKQIGIGAFSSCNWLESVELPSNMTSIPDSLFRNCFSLESITIPEGVTTIGKRAFEGCSGLKIVNFPSSLVKVDDYAFDGCCSLISTTASNVILGTETGLNEFKCIDHVWDEGVVITEPTCRTRGSKELTCTICGKKETQSTPSGDHVFSKQVWKKEPTCTEAGSYNMRCEECNLAIGSNEVTVEPLGHDWEVISEVSAVTCADTVLGQKRCKRCGKIVEDTVNPVPHTYGPAEIVEPTIWDNGYTVEKCIICGHERKTNQTRFEYTEEYVKNRIEEMKTDYPNGKKVGICETFVGSAISYIFGGNQNRHAFADSSKLKVGDIISYEPLYDTAWRGHTCMVTMVTATGVYIVESNINNDEAVHWGRFISFGEMTSREGGLLWIFDTFYGDLSHTYGG